MSFSKLTKVPISSWTKRVSTVSVLPSGAAVANASTSNSYALRSFNSTAINQEQTQRSHTKQQTKNNRRPNNRNHNRNNTNSRFAVSPSLPADHVRNAFNEDILEFREKWTLSNQRTARGSASLVDTQAGMAMYAKLKETPGVLAKSDVAAVIQGLHTSARVSVRAMSRVISGKRKEAIIHQNDILANYLEIVGNDLLSGRVNTNEFGLMQFFTAYATLNRPNRGLELYERFSAAIETNPDLSNLVNSGGKIKGSIFHLLISAGVPLERIEKLYQDTRDQGINDLNIEHNMIRAYIIYERITEALKLYSNVLKLYLEDERSDYYFGRIHEFFVGDCSDVNVATNFYFEAIEGKAPYSVECHPSAVHRLMELSWREHHDLDELINIWASFLTAVKSYREPNYNVLSYCIFVHFFEEYPVVIPEAYEKLKQIISTYNERQGRMSTIFLNSLLTLAGGKWQDKEVIIGIIDSFDVYGLPKRFDSLRVILNSLRGVDVEPEVIENFWNQRLSYIEEDPLEKYDIWALAKACNRSPERVAYFIQVWNQYVQEYQPNDAFIEEIIGFFRIPSNESVNISVALTNLHTQ